MNTGEHAPFDAALRARHAVALEQLSPRVRAQLAQRRHAALRGQAQPRARRNGLRYAIAGFAAIGVLALEFLQTADVGILGDRPRVKALAPCRTNTVEIQRNDA